MRVSRLFARTLREDPSEADVPSHRLLLRAAFIRKVAAGIYTTMPLGLRTMAKIERIVRDEMDAAGSQELRMPIVLPAEPWKETGRWQAYGDLMFRLHDRHGREFLLGPTQEEVVAPPRPAGVPLVPGPARERVPGGMEVPGRVPSALRAPAWARVPDEGRVLVRPG